MPIIKERKHAQVKLFTGVISVYFAVTTFVLIGLSNFASFNGLETTDMSLHVPLRYDILFDFNIDNMTFKSKMNITLQQFPLRYELKLNSDPSIKITNNLSYTYDEKEQILTFEVHPGKNNIYLEYDGVISNTTNGLYRTFDTSTNTTGIATQFEANYARMAIPCVDTPYARSIFGISIKKIAGMTIVANTEPLPEANQTEGIIKFADTPPMPSYLVAIVIGKLDLLEGQTKRGTKIEIHPLANHKDRAKFALDICIKSIEFYEEYTGVEYPLNLLQYAAVPDFAAAAMENWGLVTCREEFLDSDETTSMAAKSTIAEVVAHENAHMWFGNLVSPKNWDYTWLNEGFATILPILALEGVDKRLMPWEDFYQATQSSAILFDFSTYTHPVMMEGADADAIFDSISYNKGATILNMLRLFVGDKNFRKCIQKYLKNNAYKSVGTDALIKAFASEEHVAEFIEKWTTHEGFPTLFVEYKDGKIMIEQKRLVVNGTTSDEYWPISVELSDGSVHRMDGKNMSIKADQNTLINPNRHAMAIVCYSDVMFSKIIDNWDSINNSFKWVILEDTILLTLSGKRTFGDLFELVMKCKNEKDKTVIVSVANACEFLLKADNSVENRIAIASIIKRYTKLTELVTADEEQLQTKLISDLYILCSESTSADRFSDLISAGNLSAIPNHFRVSVLKVFAKKEQYSQLYELWEKETDIRLKQELLAGISSTDIGGDIKGILKMIGDLIKWQDAFVIFKSMSENKKTQHILRDYLNKHFEELYDAYGPGFQLEKAIGYFYSSAVAVDDEFISFTNKAKKIVRESFIPTINRFSEKAKMIINISH